MSLDSFFAPRRAAIIGRDGGGSSSAARLGARLEAGRAATASAGDAAADATDATSAEEPPDLVLVAGDPRDLLGAALAWLERGARALVVVGDVRLDLDTEDPEGALVRACAERGARLVGPCSGGVAAPTRGLVAVDSAVPVRPGGLALLTTGAALFEAALGSADAHGVGLHEAIDLGAAHDVGAAELVRRWTAEPAAGVICLAGLPGGGPALVSAVRDAARVKPVLALGPDAALLATCGATPVATVDDLAALAAALLRPGRPPLSGPRIAVVSVDRASSALAAAAVTARGLTLAALGDATRARLASELSNRATLDNPVDLLPTATDRHVAVVLAALAADPGVDAVLLAAPTGAALPSGRTGDLPVVAGPPLLAAEVLAALWAVALRSAVPAAAPIPNDPAIELRAATRPQLAQAILVAAFLTGRDALSPDELRRILAAYGVPTAPAITVANPHAARRAASQLAYPVDVVLRASDTAPRRARALASGEAVEAAVVALFEAAASADPRLAFEVTPATRGPSAALTLQAHPRLGHTLEVAVEVAIEVAIDRRRHVSMLPVDPGALDAAFAASGPDTDLAPLLAGVAAVARRAALLVGDLEELRRLDLTVAIGPGGAQVTDGALALDARSLG